MGRLVTPVTLLATAILAGFFAFGGYSNSALQFYALRHPGKNIMPAADLFDAIMTAVMATLFAVASFLLLRYRKIIRRRRRGECGSCGYSLTGNVSGICPECGKPISKKRLGISN